MRKGKTSLLFYIAIHISLAFCQHLICIFTTVKKKLAILFLSMAAAFGCHAQYSLGIEGGVSAGYISTNISNRASTEINYAIGYTAAIPFQYKINSWLSIEAIPNVTQKNYTLSRTDSLAGAYETFVNTYIQLPVMAKFVYGNRFQVFADAGFYAAYWIAGTVEGVTPNIFDAETSTNANGQTVSAIGYSSYNEKYQFNSRTDNRFEIGGVAGIGAQYLVTKRMQLIADGKLYESFTDQQKKYEMNGIAKYNQTFTFSAGALFSLK